MESENPVQPVVEAPPAEAAPEAKPEVDPRITALNREAQKYRQERNALREQYGVLEQFSDADRQAVLDLAQAMYSEPERAAQMLKPYVDRYGNFQDPQQGDPVDPDLIGGQEDRPLTRAEMVALFEERERVASERYEQMQRQREMESQRQHLFDTLASAGFSAYDSEAPTAETFADWLDSTAVIAAAKYFTGGDLQQAIQMVNEVNQRGVKQYISTRQEAARQGVPVAPVGGVPGQHGETPKSWKDLDKWAKAQSW